MSKNKLELVQLHIISAVVAFFSAFAFPYIDPQYSAMSHVVFNMFSALSILFIFVWYRYFVCYLKNYDKYKFIILNIGLLVSYFIFFKSLGLSALAALVTMF